MKKTPAPAETAFAQDVRKGLESYPKHLPSRYIYDAKGDALFQRIMALPEYYLTDCEIEIFETHKADMARQLGDPERAFNLIELGAGDGSKTRILLREMLAQDLSFKYLPVDISGSALQGLRSSLKEDLPDLVVEPWEGTYFEMLEKIDEEREGPKAILFLGSNIGNLLHPQARDFLSGLAGVMRSGDRLLIGFDQKKDPATILKAYNDPQGVTEAFNKNLLHRINETFGADFRPERFVHWETYNPESGTAKSYLLAREAMEVSIPGLDMKVSFEAWESIHTEISQKYDDRVVNWLASETGLEIVDSFEDSRGYYKNYLFGIRPGLST